jgi:hypothetical protein
MEAIPENVRVQFNAVLKKRNVPPEVHDHYRKWLRYFLDFRAKNTGRPSPAPIRSVCSLINCVQRVNLPSSWSRRPYTHCLPGRPEKEVRSPLDL